MKTPFGILFFLFAAAGAFAQCSVQLTTVNATCFGSCNGSITASPTGQSPFTYSWVPTGQTTQTATGLCAGSYTVVVVDANNCIATASGTITQPSQINVSITPVNVLCYASCSGSASAAVSGGTGPYSYSWNTLPNQSSATATGLCAGAYTLVVSDQNGCTRTSTVTITEPGPLTVSTSATNASCGNSCDGSASVTASGGTPGYIYSWSPGGQSTASVTGLCGGTYTCTITDANGCTNTQVVSISQPPPITLSSTQNNTVCNGDCNGLATVNPVGGTAPYIFTWSNGQSTATATGLCAGTYNVLITDANGCTSSTSIVISQPTPLIVTTSSTTESCQNCCDGTATVNPSGGNSPYVYSWNTTPSQSAQTSTGLCAGTYVVCVTDANGCMSCDTVTVGAFVSAGMSAPAAGLLLYPNPSTGRLWLQLPQNGNYRVQVCDLSGKVMREENIAAFGGQQTTLELDGLGAGTYLVRISSERLCVTFKLIRF